MDTVDVSNLNRQFLFRMKDCNRYKSQVAAEFIMKRVKGCNVQVRRGKRKNCWDDVRCDVMWWKWMEIMRHTACHGIDLIEWDGMGWHDSTHVTHVHNILIHAIHISQFHTKAIQDFSPKWYTQFDLVIAGLDNIQARQWLNETLVDLVKYDREGNVSMMLQ